ncbi:MAG TPA: uracil phosphoribosyltransferase [Candidatus Dormibacteraeota bacterium]|nr:uracil phosphoribosyltransferase [Candidatus Dormibacteraeota bacterium]
MLFASEHPLVRHKVSLLRHVDTEPKKFRELVRELSMLLCYEATRDLQLDDVEVPTPMGTAKGERLGTKIGLVPILRAGLGMVEGVLEMIPTAEVWHLGLYRDERTLQQAMLDEQAGQCGYCLSGIIISAKALLDRNPAPTRTEIATALDDNICRCGSHNRILRAVEKAAAAQRDGAAP